MSQGGNMHRLATPAKSSDPLFRAGDEDEEEWDAHAPVGAHLSLRDRVSHCYFVVFSREITVALVALSGVLLLLSLFGPRWLPTTRVYHWAEGAMTAAFVAEVTMRFVAARQPWLASAWNIAEASLCAACLFAFSWATFVQDPGREEHVLVVLLRLFAQGGRATALWCKHRHGRADPIQLHPGVAAGSV